MTEKSSIASFKAISLNLSRGALVSVLTMSAAANLYAEEPVDADASAEAETESAPVEKLEKIRVTGSRIMRADMEGAQSVQVITREDIDRTGELSIADVLRSAAGNSFGSISESSGSTAQSQSTISLRGLGEGRTLVLINGIRVPVSPSGSDTGPAGAVNLNAIPAAIVERVEITADGASAIYGSDAIAGVVNIILKEDLDGGIISYGKGLPKHEGGEEESYNLALGTTTEKGNLLFSYEHDSKGIVNLRDRGYLKATGFGSEFFSDTSGQSYYGRNVLDPANGYAIKPLAGSLDGDGNCKGPFHGPYRDSKTDPSQLVCAYDYTGEAAKTASLSRDSVMLTGRQELKDNLDFVARVIFNQNKSFSRFAPVADQFEIDQNTSGGAAFFAENGLDPDTNGDGVVNGDDDPAVVLYRFSPIGPRDDKVSDTQLDLVFGLEGEVETQLVGDLSWNANYHHNYANNTKTSTGYVLKPLIQPLLDSGKFTGGEFDAESIQSLKYSPFSQDQMTFEQATAGVSFDLGEIGGRSVSWALGTEYASWDFSSKVDDQSEAGNVLGSSGNSSAGKRNMRAFYIETVAPITDQVELNLAGRYDRYSDFGSASTGKATVRYQPLDNLTLRATYGTGFRAPTLSDLYAADSFSADYAVDYVTCGGDCDERQYNVTRSSNEDLKAEESTSFTAGAVWNITDSMDVSVDYYSIEIENVIQLLELQNSINQEVATGESSPYITRSDSGRILSAVAPMVNFGVNKTEGLDVKFNWGEDYGFGALRYDFSGTYILSFEKDEFPGGPVNDYVGRWEYPSFRFNTGVGYTTPNDAHDVYLNAEVIGPQSDSAINERDGHVDSNTVWNVHYSYNTPWDATIALGVRNLFDEEPSFRADGVTYSEELYSIQGRVSYFKYTQAF